MKVCLTPCRKNQNLYPGQTCRVHGPVWRAKSSMTCPFFIKSDHFCLFRQTSAASEVKNWEHSWSNSVSCDGSLLELFRYPTETCCQSTNQSAVDWEHNFKKLTRRPLVHLCNNGSSTQSVSTTILLSFKKFLFQRNRIPYLGNL